MSNTKLFALLLWPFYLNDLYVVGVTQRSLVALWSLDLVFFVTIPSLTLWLLHRAGHVDVAAILRRPRTELQRQFALPPSPIVAHVAMAALLAGGSFLVFWAIINPIIWALLPASPHGYAFPTEQPWRLLVILYAALTAGIIEEVVFRGIVLERLQRTHSLRNSILISAVLFGLIHWHGGSALIAMAAVWAIPVSLYYASTENLWVPILWHTFYNLACWLYVPT